MTNIRQLSENNHFSTIYLVPLTPVGSTTQEQTNEALGLIEYPKNATNTGPLTVYRFLGSHKDQLNCKSTIIISTRLIPKPTDIICDDEKVLSLQIPFKDRIPYTDLTFGDSLLDDFDVVYGDRRHLTISNLSGLDLWFEWFRDVHTDHAEDFIRNKEHVTRKSRKVSVSASFPIKVYKNDNGERGKYLDAFTSVVYTHDRVEIIVETVGNKQYLQAISVVELPGQILMSVLL
ncbi:hypothetical protein KUV96_10340 [Bacillus velezensis]|uniref:hypothetical protein n=1 Tax=Bacillus velezensis TaxID=492670 RepID=UPI001C95973C|nr:hypothetical protein [Bacillus velezensis]MBY6040619.1 hypothetical protein [Bacillus velezensis]MCA1237416.1 hypothetical protein [Bacillus velezensis]